MKIAYFTNTYPAISHTFIQREIVALESLGARITRMALRPHHGVLLHPSEHHGDATPGSAARIAVSDVDALWRELQARPYANARPAVEAMPWGSREMTITDPFGNRLTFHTASKP